MKKYISILLMSMFLITNVFATSNDELIDALEDLERDEQADELVNLDMDMAFDTFSSCEDMTDVLEDFIKEHFNEQTRGRSGPVMPFAVEMMVDDVAVDADMGGIMLKTAVAEESTSVSSNSTDISTTNLQVDGVDEADILKTDGEYLYYYNQKKQKIFIIASPLDRQTATIDLEDAEIISSIKVPQNFHGTQMYIHDEKLVMVSQRWRENYTESFLNDNARTDVVVYDIKDKQGPKLLKFSDLDGHYHDSRMIGDTLYVVSQLDMNWRWGRRMLEEDNVELDIDMMLPKTIDIAYTKDVDKRNLTIKGKAFPYHVQIDRADCDTVQYVLPTKESIDDSGIHPSFTIVRAIDISDTDEDVVTSTSFGSTQTIHMSQDSLYLTSPQYLSQAASCPINARCILPWFETGQHTLIHKYALQTSAIEYVNSTLVNGSPLSQYSMSEDAVGNFRILTTTWSPELATHLYILDEDLDMQGMLMNIEPGEEFKSSRYIGDKLYLVTFERIDPLFVIDMEDSALPNIIGELKIPGFSTYLHPYAPAAHGKQYIVGLGQDAEENEWGGTSTKGIKVDLYEIDYNKQDSKGYVSTKQLYTRTWGDRNSQSEALYNPRMFVWDEARHMLVVPMVLTEQRGGTNCQISYDENGEEIFRECDKNTRYDTTFAGLKAIIVDAETGIDELVSYNYIDQLKKDSDVYQSWDGSINPRQFSNLQFRVGYLGDVLYSLNNLFGHFAIIGSEEDEIVSFE